MANRNSSGKQTKKAFATLAQKRKLLESYLEHCKQGFSDECFPMCSIEVFNECAANNPDIFLSETIERARRERQLFWEKLGITGTLGKIRGFNASSWKTNMEQRYNKESDDVPIFSNLA